MRFNAPPGWPLPKDWSPTPDWQPDREWPPAPAGWDFWVDDSRLGPSGDITAVTSSRRWRLAAKALLMIGIAAASAWILAYALTDDQSNELELLPYIRSEPVPGTR